MLIRGPHPMPVLGFGVSSAEGLVLSEAPQTRGEVEAPRPARGLLQGSNRRGREHVAHPEERIIVIYQQDFKRSLVRVRDVARAAESVLTA